ncbi:phosphoglycolate phosphatase [Alteromonadaceae bacterium Bs31]|nr:phosphoglycolate phosphatase [Alteromonadaceae bacterium Bs31]
MLYIFDWDGTISNSAAKIVACMLSATREVGLPDRSDDEIKNIIGLGLPEAIRMLYPQIEDKDLDGVRHHYSGYFMDADVKPSPFFTGAMETMQALADAGHKITVATGKSRRGLDRVLAKLELDTFFHGSRCADETASKPNPKMLLELLDEFSCDPQQAVMIGDTEYDMAMAQAIDMPRIAVSFGAHHIDRLRPYKPVLCVDEFPNILNWQQPGD